MSEITNTDFLYHKFDIDRLINVILLNDDRILVINSIEYKEESTEVKVIKKLFGKKVNKTIKIKPYIKICYQYFNCVSTGTHYERIINEYWEFNQIIKNYINYRNQWESMKNQLSEFNIEVVNKSKKS